MHDDTLFRCAIHVIPFYVGASEQRTLGAKAFNVCKMRRLDAAQAGIYATSLRRLSAGEPHRLARHHCSAITETLAAHRSPLPR